MGVIHVAFPHLKALKIPKHINFGQVFLSKRKTVPLKLNNPIGIDVPFHISVTQEQPPHNFTIWPKQGILKSNDSFEIEISFLPLALCHASLVFALHFPMSEFEPLECHVHGSGRLMNAKQYFEFI